MVVTGAEANESIRRTTSKLLLQGDGGCCGNGPNMADSPELRAHGKTIWRSMANGIGKSTLLYAT
jgi:hypothetical protein